MGHLSLCIEWRTNIRLRTRHNHINREHSGKGGSKTDPVLHNDVACEVRELLAITKYYDQRRHTFYQVETLLGQKTVD